MSNTFDKIGKSSNETERTAKTILCIPGNWNNRTEIVTAIAKNNLNDYLFAGTLLLNLKTKKTYELEICERDDRMKKSFSYAGMVNRVSEDFLDEIDRHKYVIYLSAETGDLESAKEIAEAGNAILKAGGTGIKVETTGKAFTKGHWGELLTDFEEADLYKMYVLDSISDENGRIYSCGMHNLGFRDSVVYNEDLQESVDLLSIFGYYQLVDKPVIKARQTFSSAIGAPIFEITEELNPPYKGDELFENPYGMWKLQRRNRD